MGSRFMTKTFGKDNILFIIGPVIARSTTAFYCVFSSNYYQYPLL